MTNFFLQRPVSAIIINIMIVIFGLINMGKLSIREYPNVEIPKITVTVAYPNASADVIESNITNILEAALADVEGLESLKSSTYFGGCSIYMVIKHGCSMDQAMSQVKDAIARSRRMLPKESSEPNVYKFNANQQGMPLFCIALTSDQLDNKDLAHYAKTSFTNHFRGIEGIAQIHVSTGSKQEMIIKPNQTKMIGAGINIMDIKNNLDNNYNQPAGMFNKEIQASINTGRNTVQEFEDSLVRHHQLKDLAEVNFEDDSNQVHSQVNGETAVMIFFNKTNNANTIKVADQLHKKLAAIEPLLANGVRAKAIMDESIYIKSSLKSIYQSIMESIILVSLILWLFLGNLRLSLIPIVTIPISLIGVFSFVNAMGFSINIFTLLAIILSVGLVVDDAIVVLENIYSYLEKGHTWKESVRKGCDKIGFAIIAMTLTLASVFIPFAFIDDAIGSMFCEFAVTISMAVIISGATSLSLSPVMAHYLFINKAQRNQAGKMDKLVQKMLVGYKKILSSIVDKKRFLFTASAILMMGTGLLLYKLPREIIPNEDRNIIIVCTSHNNDEGMQGFKKDFIAVTNAIAKDTPEIENMIVRIDSYRKDAILILKERGKRKRSAKQIRDELYEKFKNHPAYDISIYDIRTGFPNIGSGRDGLFCLQTAKSYEQLLVVADEFTKKLRKSELFARVSHGLALNNMHYDIQLNKLNIIGSGITPHEISTTLSAYFGGLRCGNLIKDKALYPIIIKPEYEPESIDEIYITDKKGHKISLGSLCAIKEKLTANRLYHSEQMHTVNMYIGSQKNKTIADTIKDVQQFFGQLPQWVQPKWSGEAKSYKKTSGQMIWLILMAVVFIYLVLAMQFESFIDPLIIISTVPMGLFAGLLGVFMVQSNINIYTAIGIIMLTGLITKHGILIVEFANNMLADSTSTKGKANIKEAILQATQQRLRPILMTTISTVVGAVPLILYTSAGSEVRHAIAIVIIMGLLIGTLLTLFVMPGVYYFIKKRTHAHGR